MNCSNKIICSYEEFINHVLKIEEDTLFVISGDYKELSKNQIESLNVPEDELDAYFETEGDSFDAIRLLLASVKDGIKVELDLREFDDFISDYFCFSNISSLRGIILPETITEIHVGAFSECLNLEYVIIPKGECNKVYEYAFDSCPNLISVVFEGDVAEVEPNAVYKCEKLKSVVYPCAIRDANYFHLNQGKFNPENYFFETERLVLKPLLQKNYDAALNYYLDPRVIVYEERDEYGDEEHVKKELKKSESYWNTLDFSLCHFAIYDKANQINIGHVLLSKSNPRKEDEEALKDQTGYMIGWGLSFDNHNKGYGTEAAKAVVEWANNFLKTKRIWAYADKENKPSIRVMEKIGFSFVKEYDFLSKEKGRRLNVVYAK